MSWLGGEEEGDDGVSVGGVVGDVEPGAALGAVLGVGEERDAAGAGAGGEVIGMGVEGVDEGDDGGV